MTRNKPTFLGRSRTVRLSNLMDSILEKASKNTGINVAELMRMAFAEFLMGDYETRIKRRIKEEGFGPGTRVKNRKEDGNRENRSQPRQASPT